MNLRIFDHPGGILKEDIKIEQIVKVDVADPSNALLGQKIKTGNDCPYSGVPTAYPCSFTIYLTDRVMLLWAKNEA